MKVKAQAEFSVFELFVHDQYIYIPFDDYALEEILHKKFEDLTDEYKLVCPMENGTDHWMVFRYRDTFYFSKRMYSVEEVINELPSEVVFLLEKLDKEEFEL